MRNYLHFVLIMLLTASLSAQEASRLAELEKKIGNVQSELDRLMEADKKAGKFAVYWDSGLRLKSGDGDFKIKIGGRTHVDWSTFNLSSELQDSLGDMNSGVEMRRAEFYSEGKLYKNIEYKLELEFAGGLGLEDAYIALLDLPLGTIRFGHDEEPFCMDELTSNKYITFIERSLLDSMAPKSNVGVSLRDDFFNKRVRYAAGVYELTDGDGRKQGGDEVSFSCRVTGVPVRSDDGRRLLHLGAAFSERQVDEEPLRYRARPESHMAEYMVDTDELDADGATLYGGELAGVLGPAVFQSEYLLSDIDLGGGTAAELSSYYIQGSFFLTGEHKPYSSSEGAFGRVKPNSNFDTEKGTYGAWEVGARFSSIDLDDGSVNGGRMDSVTAAVNWYLNPNTRIMFNYIVADAEDKYEGSVDIVQTRVQVDF